jgi:hypothetical protein
MVFASLPACQCSEDFADGEDGRDHSLLGSETNLSGIAEGQDPNPEASSMPNFFEEHVHCARTGAVWCVS